MSQITAKTYDQFTAAVGSYGVDITTAEPEGVADVIEELVDPPAVGTPLPWDDVALPDTVQTEPTTGAVDEAVTGVTAASLAIAEYGSILLRMDEDGSEPVSLFNDLHVAVLREEDIVPDMAAAFEWLGPELRDTRDSAILATGPSATADMGALVQGAHGPKQVKVVVVT